MADAGIAHEALLGQLLVEAENLRDRAVLEIKADGLFRNGRGNRLLDGGRRRQSGLRCDRLLGKYDRGPA